MNVSRLYVASIYVCHSCKFDGLYYFKDGKFLKSAVVYHDGHRYIDLLSGEKYRLGINNSDVGDMYINLKRELIPIHDYYDLDFKKDNMSKRRILKKLSKAKLLNKKEDDK